jgi:hypothetical protein
VSNRTLFGPVALRHLVTPGRLVLEAFRGRRRLARLELEPGRGHVSLLLARAMERRRFWSMRSGLPVEPIDEAITSFDVVNRFSAEARMGEDVVGAVDAALISFIRQQVDELLSTMDGAALRRARRFPEWRRMEVYLLERRSAQAPQAPRAVRHH